MASPSASLSTGIGYRHGSYGPHAVGSVAIGTTDGRRGGAPGLHFIFNLFGARIEHLFIYNSEVAACKGTPGLATCYLNCCTHARHCHPQVDRLLWTGLNYSCVHFLL